MSFVTQAARSLFPHDPPRPRRSPRGPSRLSQLLAVGCALLPLGVMLQAWSETT